jgi:prolyl-tRNA editing enzyme YbaK/EbsC (Cys-tRNA(Pro) deacylase)
MSHTSDKPTHKPDNVVEVLTVDAEDSDTATFMKKYDIAPEQSLNSLVVTAKSNGERTPYLVLVPATHTLDNKGMKQALGGKVSFMPMDDALELTQMERDSVGPVGLPEGLQVVGDSSLLNDASFIVGGGKLGVKYRILKEEIVRLLDIDARDIFNRRAEAD